jgi:hypothetical protein
MVPGLLGARETDPLRLRTTGQVKSAPVQQICCAGLDPGPQGGTMHHNPFLLAVALVSCVIACAGNAQAPAPGGDALPAVAGSVSVPEGNGAPVITDGIFSPGEWDDATSVVTGQNVELRVKEYRGVVFIGVRGLESTDVGPSELFLAVPGGPIHVFHVSYQLGEAMLSPSGERPPFRFGLTTDWYANEFRRDMAESARLEKEGKNPMEIIRATSYPSDGIEFAIRRSKLPGQVWLLRTGVSALVGDQPTMLAYPVAAAETTTAGWLALKFN